MADVPAPNYADFQHSPPNPLAIAGQAQGLVNAQSQNALIQQETQNQAAQNPLIQANTAAVRQENQLRQGVLAANALVSKHINPDGTIDYTGLKKDAVNNPIAAQGLEYINNMTNNQNALVTYKDKNGVPYTTTQQAVNNLYNPTSDQPQPSQGDIDNAHAHTDFMLDGINSTLAQKKSLDMDDVLNLASNITTQHGITGGKQGVSAPEMANHILSIPNGTNPDGSPANEPDDTSIRGALMQARDKIINAKGSLTSRYGQPSNNNIPQQSAPAPGQPSIASNNGTNTPVMQGAAPGVEQQQQDRAQQSQARIGQVRQDSTNAPTISSNLDNIINLSQKIQTGAGEGKLSDIKNALITAGISSKDMQNDVSTMQQLQKYLAANVQFQGAGGANIPELNALQAANPNDKQLPQTIQAVARYAKAVQQMKIGKEQAMNNYPNIQNPAAEEQFHQRFQQVADPSAVEFNSLPTPAAKAAYLASKDDTTAKQIYQHYQGMRALGALPKQGQ